jgi:hypothetical protein
VIDGVAAGRQREQVIADVARAFGVSADKIGPLLDRPGSIVKRGLDEAMAARVQAILKLAGCDARIAPDAGPAATVSEGHRTRAAAPEIATPEVRDAVVPPPPADGEAPEKSWLWGAAAVVVLCVAGALIAFPSLRGEDRAGARAQADHVPAPAPRATQALAVSAESAKPVAPAKASSTPTPPDIAGKGFTCGDLETVFEIRQYSNDGRFVSSAIIVLPDGSRAPILRMFGRYEYARGALSVAVTAEQKLEDPRSGLDAAPVRRSNLSVTAFEDELTSLPDGRHTFLRMAYVEHGRRIVKAVDEKNRAVCSLDARATGLTKDLFVALPPKLFDPNTPSNPEREPVKQAQPGTGRAAAQPARWSPQDRALFARFPDLGFIVVARETLEAKRNNPMCGALYASAYANEQLGRSYAASAPAVADAVIADAKAKLLRDGASAPYCFN